MPGEIAERPAPAAQNAERPSRFRCDVHDGPDAQLWRHTHAVPDVAVTLPEHRQIDGDDQGAASGRRRSLDQRAREATILHEVELKPERLCDCRGDIFNRADGHGGQTIWNSHFLRRTTGQYLAIA